MATANDKSTQPASASSPPSFTILIDPPGINWQRSSIGLIHSMQSWVRVISTLDPYSSDEADIRHGLVTAALALDLTARLLFERADTPVPLEELVRGYLTSEQYAGGAQ